LIVISPHCKNGTNGGTPESHGRNGENTGFLTSQLEAKADVTLKEIRAGQDS
jgi:hypothetical protein